MNSRERIIAAFNGNIPDRVPVCLHTLSTGILKADDSLLYDLLQSTDPNVWVYMDPVFTDFEIIFGKNVYKYSKVVNEDKRTIIEINTPKGELIQITENQKESSWVVEPFFKDIRDIEKFYSFKYEPFENIDISEYLYWNEFTSQQGIASIVLYDAACMLYFMMGPEKYYISLMDDFEAVKNYTSVVADRIEKYVKRLFEIINEEPLVFLIAGPEVFTKPMTSSYYYEELVEYNDKRLINNIQKLGGIANIHQHGMVSESLNSLIKINPSAVSPFEIPPSGDMMLKDVKEKLSEKICVIGNLDDLSVLSSESEKEIKIKVFKLLRDVAPGGGFILGGTDSSVLTDKMLRSFILMGKISELYGRYPININAIEERIKFLEHSVI